MTNVPNFLEYQTGKVQAEAPKAAVAQDQDTVIGDALCHAAQIVYDVANQIARCIADNAQYAIDLNGIRKAELAVAYMQGVDFGLAMDVKRDKTYLAYMEKCIASIRKSREAGFQFQVWVPPRPADFIGYDENHCRAHSELFLHALSDCPPSEKHIKELEDEMYKSEGKDPGRLVPDQNDPSGRTLVMADLKDAPADSAAEDAAPGGKKSSPKKVCQKQRKEAEDPPDKKVELSKCFFAATTDLHVDVDRLVIDYHGGERPYWAIRFSLPAFREDGTGRHEVVQRIANLMRYDGYEATGHTVRDMFRSSEIIVETGIKKGGDKPVEDSVQEVNRLRELYRSKRINRDAYQGGIATLLATGIIGKAEFTRLNNYRV